MLLLIKSYQLCIAYLVLESYSMNPSFALLAFYIISLILTIFLFLSLVLFCKFDKVSRDIFIVQIRFIYESTLKNLFYISELQKSKPLCV